MDVKETNVLVVQLELCKEMITRLEQFKILYESKLVPRNLDGRVEKLIQQNLKLLQQEVIDDFLEIDGNWNFSPEQINVKQINSSLILSQNLGYIPKWIATVSVGGNFDCSYCNLSSLENSPISVNRRFMCENNRLTSLEGISKYIKDDLICYGNLKIFTKNDIPQGTIIKGAFKSIKF